MRHHVHRSDTKHGTIHVIPMEHMIHVVIFFLLIIENFFFFLFFQILTSHYQKSRCSTCRVTDDLVTGRIHQLYHHTNNMSWCPELSIPPGLCNLGKKILIDISSHISRLNFIHHRINLIQRIYYL